MSVLTLGIATGKIGVARGGKEMNNALLDAKSDQARRQAKLASVLGASPLSDEVLQLLCKLGVQKIITSK
jgi:phage terminase small subunit